MSTIVLLTGHRIGLGALYFLVASGLSLIYGLMGVLNFAHGAFLTFGASPAGNSPASPGPTLVGLPRLAPGRRVAAPCLPRSPNSC